MLGSCLLELGMEYLRKSQIILLDSWCGWLQGISKFYACSREQRIPSGFPFSPPHPLVFSFFPTENHSPLM